MATSYTSLLGLALPVTGELSGTWGDTVNNYISNYVDAAVAGAQTVTADTTLTKTTGASLSGTSSQYAIIIASPASANITITAPAASKIYTIINTSATYTVKIVGAGPTTGITLNASEKAVVAWNGSDFVRISSTSVFGSPSTAMTIDTSGNVGIGITSPGSVLDVRKSAGSGAFITYVNTTAFANTNIIETSYTLNNANSGLATAAVIGVINTAATSNSYGDIYFKTATPSGLSEKMRLDSSGNLGIGTSSPAKRLDIRQAYTSDTVVAQIGNTNNGNGATPVATIFDFTEANGTPVSRISSIYTQSAGTTSLAFGTYGSSSLSEKMRLDSSGNLGIGTTSPAVKLDVSSGSAGTAILRGTYGFSQSNYNLSLINDGTTYGYLSQSPAAGGIVVADGMKYYGSGFWKPDGTTASSIQQLGGNTIFTNNTGLTAAVNFTPTEWMRLDSSGNLLIGGTTQYGAAKLTITSGGAYIALNSTTGGYSLVRGFDNGTERWGIGQAGFGGADGIGFYTGSSTTERMRLDSSGNLLVGTTSVSNSAGWDKLVQIYATNYPALSLKNSYRQWDVAVDGNTGALRFYDVTASAERMRINSGGALLVGTTSAIGVGSIVGFYNASGNVLHVQGGSSSVNNIVSYDSGGTSTFYVTNSGAVGAQGYATKPGLNGSYGGNSFNINWTGGAPYLWIDVTNIGQISIVSDYRLKENIASVSSNAISRVMQLNPVQFNRKEVGMFGGSTKIEEGFLAHELQAVIPSAVHGEKDALTEDGGIQPQSLNWAPLVATLVKAIQEQQATIQSLTDRISQLEAK